MDGRQLDDILAAVPLPMVLIGAREQITTANAAGRALLGEGQIGRHYAIGLRQPALLAAIGAALREGVPGQAPYEVIGPSGTVTWLVTVTPLSNAGRPEALCAFQDVTEQERIGAFRRDFVANVSHELRSPLTTLVSIIDTLKGAARDDPAARERFLTAMQHEAQRMARLVRDLLSLSRTEAEERRRPNTPVDVAELARAVTDTLRPQAEAAGVALELGATPGIPPIPADADQLTQVLQNLIENAIKYDTLGRRVTVRIHPGQGEGMLRIDVADQGEGIEPQHLPRLTERFYRVDRSRSREQGGTGLGLAIVKHIVNRHRGRLAIASERGRGTTVSVFLPTV
ncbi:MAG TPA: GHKL domain-containing protein [Paracoccus solventivorans]|uniref:histidine kinase n=2 Tax=Paracoccus solventivorans TaxID=53463 RepID=A0A832PLZ5_9RHOB|nr:ATP-binding protein [Paracoccus solventivorans]HHW33772.1 GHKL domain-containing protein [Paracoccus solventivorans]